MLLVFLGGVLGTAGRYGLTFAFGLDELGWATLLANVIGAFGIGVVVAVLTKARFVEGRKHRWHLFLVVGFFGGLTTYSALALLMAVQTLDGSLVSALVYGFTTVLVGALLTVVGLALGTRLLPGASSTPTNDGGAQ